MKVEMMDYYLVLEWVVSKVYVQVDMKAETMVYELVDLKVYG